MDSHELFRKLGAGAKFDVKRFRRDAERFKVIRTKDKEAGASEILGELDFFANQSKKPPSPSDDGREGNGLREPRVEALESQPENKGNEPKLVGKARAAEKRKGDGQSMEGRGKKKKAQGSLEEAV
uniref:probable ATP-dependent RNA helicase DDX52 n=1 Tax=Podarcis muralis TaxID=64176 RepID=UPI00109F99BD|nr:probable ATP-dependent RNA helicase DDX52 [Podarcis muralis]